MTESLLETLLREPAAWARRRETGAIETPERIFAWDPLRLTLHHHDGATWAELPEGSIIIQLSRSTRESPRNWLHRLISRDTSVEAWLHAEIRTPQERIRFSARVDEPTSLEGLVDLEHPGVELEAERLIELLTVLRGFGAEVLDRGRPPQAPTGRVARILARLGIALPTGTGETRVVSSSEALRDALLDPPPNGIIHLERGRYELLEAIDLRGPLILAGESAEDTRVFIGHRSGALRATRSDEGAVWLRDLTITGGRIPNSHLVIASPAAGLVLERCRVYGAGDVGVEVHPAAMLYVKNCDLSHNHRCGARLLERGRAFFHDTHVAREELGLEARRGAHLTLLSCTFRRCERAARLEGQLHIEGSSFTDGLCGLHIHGEETRGLVTENSFNRQREVGVLVQGAFAELHDNTCRHGALGLHLLDTPEETRARGNTCAELEVGLRVTGGHTTLEDNSCVRDDIGLHLVDARAAHLDENTCDHNRVGLFIEDSHDWRSAHSAPPGYVRITRGQAASNDEHGVVARGAARGRIAGCVVSNNARSGIFLRDGAVFEIDGNTCHHNRRVGIHVDGHAGGALLRNDCGHNGHANILIDQDRRAAEIGVEDNVCISSRYGIRLDGNTRATLGPNELRHNHRRELHVGPDARPSLHENMRRLADHRR